MRHSRKSRRAFSLPDVLPFIVGGAAILVAVPLAILLSAASSRYAEAKKYEVTPTAAVSLEAEPREAPAPTTEATPEPEEPVSRYAAVELTEEDAYILACLVYHEARGEPFEGQAAVVEVVFNRCLSDEFPDTVEEVVFQKYGDVWQFSPAPYLYTAEPSEVQYNAVMYAYNAEEPVVPPETVFFSTSPYITISGGIDRDELESLWGLGYANSRRLQFTENGLAGLAHYITKSPVGSKAWNASKNLVDPEPKTRDGHISARRARELARDTTDNREFEKLYCKRKGIFAGDGAGNFDWQKPITREQVAAVLYRTLERAGLLEAIPDKK